MTIAETAPHGRLIEALSRTSVLVREHRDELPELSVTLDSASGQVWVQVVKFGGAEELRRCAVDHLARLLKLNEPKLRGHFYCVDSSLWHVYTPIETD